MTTYLYHFLPAPVGLNGWHPLEDLIQHVRSKEMSVALKALDLVTWFPLTLLPPEFAVHDTIKGMEFCALPDSTHSFGRPVIYLLRTTRGGPIL